MAIFDSPQVRSDEWWVNRLEREIHDRNSGRSGGKSWSTAHVSNRRGTRPGLDLLDAWLRGEPPMPQGRGQEYQDAWRAFLRLSRTNYAELVISSVTDRLVPIGWSTAADDDPDGDQKAAEVAAETNLMVNGGDAIQDMLALADGYLLVGRNRNDRPTITAESPLWTITAESRTGEPLAGLRVAVDEWTGEKEFWLYRPGYVRTARREAGARYEFDEAQSVPGGEFPLVHLRNRRGVGDYERHLDALTRINDTMFTRLVLTKLQAHRQRALEAPAQDGDDQLEIEYSPEDFATGPDALWELPPGVKLWESQAADLNPVRAMVLDDVKHLCAVTGTPLSDAVPDGANQSAKGSQIVEDKTLFRVMDRQRRADRGLAQALALAFKVLGDDARADAATIRTLWSPIVRHSMVDMGQAASQLQGIMPRDWIALNVMQERPGNLPAIQRMRVADMLTEPEKGAPGGAVA